MVRPEAIGQRPEAMVRPKTRGYGKAKGQRL